MDIQFQAIKSQILSEIKCILEKHVEEFNENLERVDKDRKREEKILNLEIQDLKNRFEKGEVTTNHSASAIKLLQIKYSEQSQLITTLSERLATIEKGTCPDSNANWTLKEQLQVKNKQMDEKWLRTKQQLSKIDTNSKYLSEFIYNQGIIQRKNTEKGQFYQLVGSVPIHQQKVNKFKILKTISSRIFFGIVDGKYTNDRNSDQEKRKQCICYSAYGGNISVSGQRMGSKGRKGAEEGETIIMKVSESTITWQVEQEVRAEFSDLMISDRSINWVPFIIMYYKQDKIEWI